MALSVLFMIDIILPMVTIMFFAGDSNEFIYSSLQIKNKTKQMSQEIKLKPCSVFAILIYNNFSLLYVLNTVSVTVYLYCLLLFLVPVLL